MQTQAAEAPEWVKEVIQYLKEGKLPKDKKKSQQVWMRSARYTLIEDTLYRQGYKLPLLKRISKFEAEYVLRKIHERVCGNHARSRMLAHKAIRSNYFWLYMNEESARIVQSYDKNARDSPE